MNKYQETIKSETERIFTYLSILGAAVTAFQGERKKIQEQISYTEDYKETKVNEAQAALVEKFRKTYEEKISPALAKIREAAEAMEQQFTLSAELSAALTLVGVAGDKLTSETLRPMWRQFIGNHSALVALRAALDQCEILPRAVDIDQYIFSADSKCTQLEDQALTLYTQPGTNLNQAVWLGRMLEDFCEKEGVELSKPFIQHLGAEDYSAYYNERLKTAFGV